MNTTLIEWHRARATQLNAEADALVRGAKDARSSHYTRLEKMRLAESARGLAAQHTRTVIELESISVHSLQANDAHDASKTQAAHDVLAERQRQADSEGWAAAHDDMYANGELITAATCYASEGEKVTITPPMMWPWDKSWWKPKGARSNLVRAAALLIAEIERIDRTAQQKGGAA